MMGLQLIDKNCDGIESKYSSTFPCIQFNLESTDIGWFVNNFKIPISFSLSSSILPYNFQADFLVSNLAFFSLNSSSLLVITN